MESTNDREQLREKHGSAARAVAESDSVQAANNPKAACCKPGCCIPAVAGAKE
jgi:hypothetical protein